MTARHPQGFLATTFLGRPPSLPDELGKMAETLGAPRANLSPFAPRIHTIKIKPDKVREVIGSGGKVIRGIIEQTGVKIDIEDDGSIQACSLQK